MAYDIVLVSYNSYGCPDSLRYVYEFLFKGLYVPNAFAPDNPAAQVHEFRPKGTNLESYEIRVFDSWGNELWQSTELDATGGPAQGWDGTFEGEPLPMDTYLWKVRQPLPMDRYGTAGQLVSAMASKAKQWGQ